MGGLITMKKIILNVLIVTLLFVAVGCTPATTNIDIKNDEGKAVMGLDYRDFDQAASDMIQSMLASGALRKQGGGRYVVAQSRIVNDTMQRIDIDQLMAKIEQELLNSGQVVMTSAVGGQSSVDPLMQDARKLRDSEEFDQNTIAAKKTLIAPELSISGKIFQRNLPYEKGMQQVEYYFQLKVSDLKSGLRLWQNEKLIGKRGSNKSVAW
jgi:penicillin-binding protein activator